MNFLKKHINPKLNFINRYFNQQPISLLDVGAGNHSATKIKSVFPHLKYFGLDLNRNYSNSLNDFNLMEHFYELDLTQLNYEVIPNNFFDCIIMSHVIEHLHNGEKVLPLLLSKLKPNGKMYLEYPSQKSLTLPSMYGTLNFYDDKTHVRVYTIPELNHIIEKHQCQIIKSGIRRNMYYIFAMPFRIFFSLLRLKKIRGNIFWDILGFAEFIEISKNK